MELYKLTYRTEYGKEITEVYRVKENAYERKEFLERTRPNININFKIAQL